MAPAERVARELNGRHRQHPAWRSHFLCMPRGSSREESSATDMNDHLTWRNSSIRSTARFRLKAREAVFSANERCDENGGERWGKASETRAFE